MAYRINKPVKNYDPACAVLAEHFLNDYAAPTAQDKQLLAQAIQDAVENWLTGYDSLSGGERI